nr:PREDICTED: protein D2-like [Bemisia tabaci]
MFTILSEEEPPLTCYLCGNTSVQPKDITGVQKSHLRNFESLKLLGANACTDPDVPTRENPTEREYLHWLVGNIYQDQWTTGETIVDYIGPIPEHMNGPHRMVFLVYKQPSTDFIRFEEERLPPKHDQKKRGKFSSMNFTKKYNLTGPVAANFFMAYWTQNMAANLSKPTSSTTEDPIYDYTDEESKNHTAKVKT